MSLKERFIIEDSSDPPCCDSCNKDICDYRTCKELNDLIQSNRKALLEAQVKLFDNPCGWDCPNENGLTDSGSIPKDPDKCVSCPLSVFNL